MSVRRTAARGAQYGDRYGTLKGVLFWGFLLAASFIFGLLVVSPLINFASGSHGDQSASATTQAPQQSPQPSSTPAVSAPAAPREDATRRMKRSEEPGILVTEDRANQGVQRTETVDEAPAKRKRASEDTTKLANPSDERALTDRTDSTKLTDDESATRTGDETGRERATSEEPAKPARTETRPPRKRRKTDESEITKPAPKPEVQKGESID